MTTVPTRSTPHRFPFVLVDIEDGTGGGGARARRLISIDDALLEGSCGGTAPQTLLIEAIAQTAAQLAGIGGTNESATIAGISRARFERPPRVGDRLLVEARFTQKFGTLVRIEGRVLAGEEPLLEAEVLIALERGEEGG